ncbi:InlB B-repeat-containing protein [Anaeromyxobacter terrae]|uniref:InlB B-repeat-containing protein n=1 Tax=Anaeromyxobacter terrae TaxID=2925406 RepID=UPI001F570E4D|nr:hypothetical protein [Anaeromyxobacter sp. SG22]
MTRWMAVVASALVLACSGDGDGAGRSNGPPNTVSLTVHRSGECTGVVSSEPAGLSCTDASCSGTFAAGTTLTLIGTPDPGCRFDGWSGACTGLGPCTIVLDASATATATFTLRFDQDGFLADLLDAPIPVEDTIPSAPLRSTCATRTVNGPGNEAFGGPVPCVSGFCLENAPGSTWLWAIAGASRSSLWAVGEGALLHYGSRWDTACGPLDGWILYSAYAKDDRDVWVAGQGTIGHFDGASWSATPSDPGWRVFEIFGDAREAFAAYSGTTSGILRWNGAGWAPSYGGPSASGLSVWGDGAGRAWGTDGGLLVTWDGTRWTHSVRPFNLNDLWAPAGGEPWFAGFTFRDPEWWIHDAAVCTLERGAYLSVPLPPGYREANWVRGSASDDVWVNAWSTESGAEGVMLRWDGAAWTIVASPGESYPPLVLARDEAWLVQNARDPGTVRSVPRVMRFDGTQWTTSLELEAPSLAAAVTASGAVWAAAEDGLWRFDGTRWTSMHGRLGYSAHLASDGLRVWAAGYDGGGSSTVAAWDGSQMTTFRLSGDATALYATGGHAWLATAGSTRDGANARVHHWDGVSWTELDTGTPMYVHALWASAPTDLWAVGVVYPATWTSLTGIIAHWDGAAWVRREMRDYELRSVWGSGARDVWVSGDTAYCTKCPQVEPDPLLLRWNGNKLAKVASLAFEELAGRSASEVWGIAAEQRSGSADRTAVLHRFDGTRWSATARLDPPFRPYRLHAAPDGTLWGVDGGPPPAARAASFSLVRPEARRGSRRSGPRRGSFGASLRLHGELAHEGKPPRNHRTNAAPLRRR